MLEKLLWVLFPKTINNIIQKVNIVAEYGSVENFYDYKEHERQMQESIEEYEESMMREQEEFNSIEYHQEPEYDEDSHYKWMCNYYRDEC